MNDFFSRIIRLVMKLWRGENPMIITQSLEKWENQYGAGKWNYLLDIPPNIPLLIEAIRLKASQKGSTLRVLDVGCGNGAIPKLLQEKNITVEYTGIDLSPTAISRAQIQFPQGTFFVSRVEKPIGPEGKYDVIVFAEVLYYTDYRQVGTWYAPLASRDTLILVSLYRTVRTQWIWFAIKNWFHVIRFQDVTDDTKHVTWRIAEGRIKYAH